MLSFNFVKLFLICPGRILPMEIFDHIIFGNSIHDYVLFAIIFTLGLVFKRIFSRGISKLFFRLFTQNGTNSSALVFVSLLLRPIELLIMSVVCYWAINQLDYPLKEVLFSRENIINNVTTYYQIRVANVLDKLFLFFLILSTFWIILRIIDSVAHVLMRKASVTKSKTDDQIIPFVKELSKITTIIIGVFIALKLVCEVNVAAIITGLGIGGIAIALAAKDTLQNLLGSFTIFADKPFVTGDLIRVDKYEGTIEKVGFRSTLLRTTDKTVVVIPNSKMIDTPLENLTLRNLRRMKFYLNLQYDTPPTIMMAISKEITQCINQHRHASQAFVHFESFGESSLNLLVRYYIGVIDDAKYLNIREEINYKIIDIVIGHGAHFALPSKTIYLHQHTGTENPLQEPLK